MIQHAENTEEARAPHYMQDVHSLLVVFLLLLLGGIVQARDAEDVVIYERAQEQQREPTELQPRPYGPSLSYEPASNIVQSNLHHPHLCRGQFIVTIRTSTGIGKRRGRCDKQQIVTPTTPLEGSTKARTIKGMMINLAHTMPWHHSA